MRKIERLLAILTLAFFAVGEINAQCEPDTSCIDTGDPGQICPSVLPDVTVNEFYDQVITVLSPDTAYVGDLEIPLAYIVVDSVLNLPPGIEYFANADKFYPDSIYCIQVVGTPTEAGDFQLNIYVTPYIYNAIVDDTISVGQVIDSTSVILTVQETSGVDPYKVHEFRVLPNAPNPFSDVTRLGFYTPFDDRIELKVYNILGKLMHEEIQGAPPGEHFFKFDGNGLLPGTYFYRITNSSEFYTGKFIKSR